MHAEQLTSYLSSTYNMFALYIMRAENEWLPVMGGSLLCIR